jgi:hypothetical protein
MGTYEPFIHKPWGRPHTARDLVRALGVPDDVPLNVPDDRPVMVAVADYVGSDEVGDRHVVVEVLTAYDNNNYMSQAPDLVVYLGGDFPAGLYERWKDTP